VCNEVEATLLLSLLATSNLKRRNCFPKGEKTFAKTCTIRIYLLYAFGARDKKHFARVAALWRKINARNPGLDCFVLASKPAFEFLR
jgi:hypothetical protein